jgi:hypothetical protein
MRTMKNPPINIGIDPQDRARCFVSVPVDIEYMKEQRKTLIALMKDAPLSDSERQEMEHLVGFLDHFIFGIYGVVAEYPTANRTHY